MPFETWNTASERDAVGEMFNSDMWERVAQAVAKLMQPKPEAPNAIN